MAATAHSSEIAALSGRETILARIPSPVGGDLASNELPWPRKTRAELVQQLSAEFRELGVQAYCAGTLAHARQYIQGVVEREGGDAVVALRSAVQALGIAGHRFHTIGSFPASQAAFAVTAADYALADTGTIVVFSAAGEGRLLSLIAPINIVVVPVDRILAHLPEFFSRVLSPAEVTSAAILVTGPSRTADIELTLTVGVHGPGEVHAVIIPELSHSTEELDR